MRRLERLSSPHPSAAWRRWPAWKTSPSQSPRTRVSKRPGLWGPSSPDRRPLQPFRQARLCRRCRAHRQILFQTRSRPEHLRETIQTLSCPVSYSLVTRLVYARHQGMLRHSMLSILRRERRRVRIRGRRGLRQGTAPPPERPRGVTTLPPRVLCRAGGRAGWPTTIRACPSRGR